VEGRPRRGWKRVHPRSNDNSTWASWITRARTFLISPEGPALAETERGARAPNLATGALAAIIGALDATERRDARTLAAPGEATAEAVNALIISCDVTMRTLNEPYVRRSDHRPRRTRLLSTANRFFSLKMNFSQKMYLYTSITR
jgi:hypothetical protein